jgi:hypothetical protein
MNIQVIYVEFVVEKTFLQWKAVFQFELMILASYSVGPAFKYQSVGRLFSSTWAVFFGV